ncbi:MAG TPA: alpha/beta fold hydrolase [Caulobacteraceae bacterium]|jgi:haloacetate dehalogenase
MTAFGDFENLDIKTADSHVFLRRAGSGPPLLLLHGFPQTHLMWRDVAPRLTERFTVVCADLRGCGRSGCPASTPDHAPYSKRATAQTALAYWPWSLLAQPAPLPEALLLAAPEAVIDDALGNWGSPASTAEPEVRAAYVDALKDTARVHAICEEYRAAATCDWAHDSADKRAGRRIGGPVLALWSGAGSLGAWYADAGGPLALWRTWADVVEGAAVDGGHFFPEESPDRTARTLAEFFGATAHGAPRP